MSTENLLSVHGTLGIRERVALPPGAVATVKVVDGDGEVLAATAVALDQPPVEFATRIDPALVDDPDHLFVWGMLRSDAGVWGTVDLVPLAGDGLDVILTRIDA